MSEAILQLNNVSKVFKLGLLGKVTIRAVDRVSLDVRRGEILGILGESGSGKSTIAKLILKIYEPTQGRILYRGIDICKYRSGREIKKYYKNVQGVFQDPYASFNPRRRVLDSLIDVIKNYFHSIEEGEVQKIVGESVEKVGLNIRDVLDRYPHEFSGGQLQRLSIARALLVKPEVIIADEPVSMVDASTRVDILNIFIDLKEEMGLTSMIIGHDLGLTHYVSDRVIVLYRGQVVEEGPSDILLDPAHPYTKMLLESIPRINAVWRNRTRYGVGLVKLESRAVGCRFADRCPFRKELCASQEPPYVSLGRSRVRCWLYT